MATHTDGIPVAAPVSSSSNPAVANVNILPAEYYHDRLSDSAKSRRPSPIRGLLPLELRPGMISLLAGKPNPATFPITALSYTTRVPTSSSGEEAKEVTLELSADHLAQGLQYGATSGFPPFVKWLEDLQEREHGRKRSEGWKLTTGLGSQDLLQKAVLALLNPGDAVLVESPVYAGALPLFQHLGCELIEVATDDEGIRSSSLREILESWPAGKPKAKLLYTVPYGCNPTGMTATLPRRKDVLSLAVEYDFLIMEDDPYFFLYFGSAERSPSYFALEPVHTGTAGRVIRFDSMSKVLSAGLRLGFATGPAPIIDAIDLHTATANLQSPGLTQALAYGVLSTWGYDGFRAHTAGVSAFYRAKRDVFIAALERHLAGLAEWTAPEAGMFVWFKLKVPGENSEALIRTEALARGVLALPGTVFLPDERATAYVRASFSLLDEADVNEACRRLAETVRAANGAA